VRPSSTELSKARRRIVEETGDAVDPFRSPASHDFIDVRGQKLYHSSKSGGVFMQVVALAGVCDLAHGVGRRANGRCDLVITAVHGRQQEPRVCAAISVSLP
jgi:hypothetical protein